MCGAKLQFLDAASGEKGCEISTCNFHIRVVKKDMALELIFFHKNALLIKDGIIKDKYYISVH